jgi:hypothetical protein
MISDQFIDLEETGYLWMSGWRCMNCGHLVDPVTEHNRKLQAQGVVAVATVKRPGELASKTKTSRPPQDGVFDLSQRESRAVSMISDESQAA